MKGRTLFKMHSLAGLLSGLLLLVVSASGCVLVFAEEIDRALHPAVVRVAPAGKPLPLERIYRQARADFPHIGYVRFRTLPKTPRSAVEMSLETGTDWYFAYYNPYTGRLLGVRNADTYFLGWLLNLHYRLMAGKTGEYTVALLALSLVLSTLTGLVVYRKHLLKVLLFRQAFAFTNWRTASSSLHRLVGIWSLAFNLVIALTGFWMLRHLFTGLPAANPTAGITVNWPLPYPVDAYVQRARAALPGLVPYGVWLPRERTERVLVFGQVAGGPLLHNEYSSTVALHPATGRVVSVTDARQGSFTEQLDIIALPLHAGQYGGLLVKILYCAGGLAPALLSLTGGLLWLRRTRRGAARPKKTRVYAQ
jgi:uncharacterized iron-regulated membrane protein